MGGAVPYIAMGWFNLQPALADEDRDEHNRHLIDGIRAEIENALWGSTTRVELLDFGFDQRLVIEAVGNRPQGRPEQFELLIRRCGELMKGTYGVMWEHDDSADETENSFRVRVMIRGALSERADPFFSPIVPTIEDPDPDLT